MPNILESIAVARHIPSHPLFSAKPSRPLWAVRPNPSLQGTLRDEAAQRP